MGVQNMTQVYYKEDDFLSNLLLKFTNPQEGDEIYLYGLIAISFATFYLIYNFQTNQSRKNPQIKQLTLSDTVNQSTTQSQDETDVVKSFLQTIDRNQKEFEKELSGRLSMEGYCNLRFLIMKQVHDEFKCQKEEMMICRINAFKNNDWKEYLKFINMATQKFQNLQAERTKNALDFLKIDLKSYEISQRITSHDPVFSRRVIEQDLNLSQNIEKREISETKAQIKEYWIEQKRLEGQLQLILSTLDGSNPVIAKQVQLLEQTKVIDTMWVKFNIKIPHLLRAVQHYELQNDKDVKAVEDQMRQKLYARIQAQQQAQVLNDQELKLAQQISDSIGAVECDQRGLLPLSVFIQIQQAKARISHKSFMNNEQVHLDGRRELLKKGLVDEYATEIEEWQIGLRSKEVGILRQILHNLKIKEEFWLPNMQYFMNNAQLRKQIDEAGQKTTKQLADEKYKELAQRKPVLKIEDTLRLVKMMEEKSIFASKKVQELQQKMILTPKQQQNMVDVEQMKVSDELWLEFGVDGQDLNRAIKEHELENTVEFTAMMMDLKEMASKLIK